MPIEAKWLVMAAAVNALPIAGCAPKAMSSAELSPAPTSDQGYLIGPGDKIRIRLYDDESFSGEYQISPAGLISLPLIGDLDARQITIDKLRDIVTERLADGYYIDPRISADIVEFRPFYILGEVNRPGEYPYAPDLTLGKAVAIAGGYTYRANERVVSIQRSGSGSIQRVKVDQIVRIGPGDTIEILERYF